MHNNFAKNLKILRKARGLKQSDMKEPLGFTQARWSAYESMIAEPSLSDLTRIAEYFNVSESDILHRDFEQDDYSNIPSMKKANVPDTFIKSLHTSDIEVLKALIIYLKNEVECLKDKMDLIIHNGQYKRKET